MHKLTLQVAHINFFLNFLNLLWPAVVNHFLDACITCLQHLTLLRKLRLMTYRVSSWQCV